MPMIMSVCFQHSGKVFWSQRSNYCSSRLGDKLWNFTYNWILKHYWHLVDCLWTEGRRHYNLLTEWEWEFVYVHVNCVRAQQRLIWAEQSLGNLFPAPAARGVRPMLWSPVACQRDESSPLRVSSSALGKISHHHPPWWMDYSHDAIRFT